MISGAEAFGETDAAGRAQCLYRCYEQIQWISGSTYSQPEACKRSIPIKRDLHSEVELLAYVNEFMEEVVAEVARDPSLSVPLRKLDCFPGVHSSIREMALSYNALRNALEHHHDSPKIELKVTVRRIIPIVGDHEIKQFPVVIQAGGMLGVKMINVDKIFHANQKVVLEPQDSHDLVFTVKHIIAASIFQWFVGPGNPKLA